MEKQYCTMIFENANGEDSYEHDVNAEPREVEVYDTGEYVTVMEWQGTAYSSGQQVPMHNCTLYKDADGNLYTTFDGDSDEDYCVDEEELYGG